MRSKSYLIDIRPIPWQRPGHNGNHFYDRQQAEKLAYGLSIARCHGDDPLFEGPLSLDVIFYMQIPKLLRNRQDTHYHWKKPDADNYIKLLLDSITQTSVVWEDDAQVACLSVKKIYDKQPRVEFTIAELE